MLTNLGLDVNNVYFEYVEHLFISCFLMHHIWRLIHFTFNISPPMSIVNMLGSWLNGVDRKNKTPICIGVCVLFGQYGIVEMKLFSTKGSCPFFTCCTHIWIHVWFFLHPPEQRDLIDLYILSRLWLYGLYSNRMGRTAYKKNPLCIGVLFLCFLLVDSINNFE